MLALVVMRGKDSFRLPKELVVYATAALILGVAGVALIIGRLRLHFDRRDPVHVFAAAVFAWTAISTIFSTNRAVSLRSLEWVAALLVIFVATYTASRGKQLQSIATVLVAAVINALVVVLQATKLWTPFKLPEGLEEGAGLTGFVGNPRDLGAYLLAPAIVALALALVSRGKTRLIYAGCTVILVIALAMTRGQTATVAFLFAAAVALILYSTRWGWTIAVATIVIAAIAVFSYEPLNARATRAVALVRAGDYDAALTHRLTAFLAAWRMGTDNPITGVGPGAFGWAYYDYKLAIEKDYPTLQQSLSRSLNFGQTHNDHLQTLAVAGVPGYLLFLTGIWLVGAASFRVTRQNERGAFVHVAALPFAVGAALVALTFFPLELAVTAATYAFVGGVLLSWSRET